MHRSKLFQVLVIGSGLALAGCGDEPKSSPKSDNSTPTNSSQPTTPSDSTDNSNATTPNDSSDDSSDDSSANSGELENCFCNTQPECCEEVDGESQVVEGFECCWGTSC